MPRRARADSGFRTQTQIPCGKAFDDESPFENAEALATVLGAPAPHGPDPACRRRSWSDGRQSPFSHTISVL